MVDKDWCIGQGLCLRFERNGGATGSVTVTEEDEPGVGLDGNELTRLSS